MKKEIIINSSSHEVRVAMLEDGDAVELLVERAASKRMVGNVYLGVVTSVKPGLQAAFVDIGLERAGFLHASDLDHDDSDEEEESPAPWSRPTTRAGTARSTSATLRTGIRFWSRCRPRKTPSAPRGRD